MFTPIIRVFIAYSRKDSDFMQELKIHLTPLERSQKIKIWCDNDIEAGSNWDLSIKNELQKADIILLLVSSDSMASDYFYSQEVKEALKRDRRKETKVIPIVLRPCFWDETPLKTLQALPKDGQPISRWEKKDEAYVNIVKSIKKVISVIKTQKEVELEEVRRQEELNNKLEEEQKRKEDAERQMREWRQTQETNQSQNKANTNHNREPLGVCDKCNNILVGEKLNDSKAIIHIFWSFPIIGGFLADYFFKNTIAVIVGTLLFVVLGIVGMLSLTVSDLALFSKCYTICTNCKAEKNLNSRHRFIFDKHTLKDSIKSFFILLFMSVFVCFIILTILFWWLGKAPVENYIYDYTIILLSFSFSCGAVDYFSWIVHVESDSEKVRGYKYDNTIIVSLFVISAITLAIIFIVYTYNFGLDLYHK
jgi:hypothetical protein